MFSPQNSRNEIHSVGVCPPKLPGMAFGHDGQSERKKTCSACPPIHAWMPNHPQATMARISAGRFEPTVPYEARANTGKGMPYFVPGCEFSRIGMRTMEFPSRMVNSACCQLMPAPIKPDASMYVGMQCAIDTHSAASLYVPQVRRSGGP